MSPVRRVSVKHLLRVASLLTAIFLCLAFLVVSFHSRVRFANPITDQFARPHEDFACYRDLIYGDSESADVLFFGASRTLFAVDSPLVERAYQTVTGHDISVFSFSTAWSNPELAYFFFRDYLQHNPAPEVALFELTTTLQMEEPVRYVHPLYPYLAPAYLYRDELNSWDFVPSKLFAFSDFIRLVVRHIDLSLTNLLVADRKFITPSGDNCLKENITRNSKTTSAKVGSYQSTDNFEVLMTTVAEPLLTHGDWEKAADYGLLVERYKEHPQVARRLENYGPQWTKKKPTTFWYRGLTKNRSAHYYKRIVELGQAHGVRVGFYILPGVYSPEPPTERILFIEQMLGAPVYTIPFKYLQVLYHHYMDAAHVKEDATVLTSAWAASLIELEGSD
jgi:hypothetical protein